MHSRVFFLQLFAFPILAAAQPTCFEVTDDALKLARRFSVVNEQLAFSGAPVVDPSRPYGAASTQALVRQILDNPKLTEREIDLLHRSALRSFQILLRFAAISPGSYRLGDGSTAIVTAEQLKLQQHFNFIDEIDSGRTGIDPKRPYGEYECWELDMAEAIGETPVGDEETSCEKSFTITQHKRLQALHRSMLEFVRALLAHGKLPGRRYKADSMMIGLWERCE